MLVSLLVRSLKSRASFEVFGLDRKFVDPRTASLDEKNSKGNREFVRYYCIQMWSNQISKGLTHNVC